LRVDPRQQTVVAQTQIAAPCDAKLIGVKSAIGHEHRLIALVATGAQPTLRRSLMANITRFDPFADPFEDLFRRVLRPIRWESDEQPLQIKVDVEEDDKTYKVKAEIPGVKKEDINIQVDRNQVSISAESKREKEVKDKGKVIRSERYYGSLFRSFSLAHDVDQAGANAKYADGILELTLPKKVTSETKKLSIQ
jgi:HSP20 family protein